MACETVIYVRPPPPSLLFYLSLILMVGEQSGGGFSNVFAMPSYQKKAVSTYFKNHLPPYSSAQYNNSQQVRPLPLPLLENETDGEMRV